MLQKQEIINFDPTIPCLDTGFDLLEGKEYTIELKVPENWTDATIEATPLKCASPPDFEPEHVSPRQLLKDIAATPNPTPTPGVTMTVDEFEVAKAVKRAEASGKVQSRRGKSKSPGGSSSRRRSLRNSKPVELEN